MAAIRCKACGKEMGKGSLKYVIEIKSFADYDGYLEEYAGDIEEGISELLEAIEGMDSQMLEEDVWMERSYIVCKSCRDRFVNDPFQTGTEEGEREVSKGTLH